MSALPTPPFDATVLRSRGSVVLRLTGELDIATAVQLDDLLRSVLLDRPESLLVDLRAVSFIDPAGARPLRMLSATPDRPARFRLRADGQVRRVVRLLGLGQLLEA